MISKHAPRNSLRNLLVRLLSLRRSLLFYLARPDEHRKLILLTYLFCAPLTALAFVRIFFELNLDLAAVFAVPTFDALYQVAVSFLVQPFSWVGIHVPDLWKTIIALSCMGASVFVNADFLERWSAIQFISGRHKKPNPFNRDWTKPPPPPEPVRNSVFWRIVKPIFALLLGYLLVGLIPLVPMIAYGIMSFLHSMLYLGAWLAMIVAFIIQELLAPFERPGKDDYWGTRSFLRAFRVRDKLDSFLRRSSRDPLRLVSPRKSDRWWMVLRHTVHHGAHIVSLAIWLLCLMALLRNLTG